MDLFHLTISQAESLANKAGLSVFAYTSPQESARPWPLSNFQNTLFPPENQLASLLKECGSRQRRQLYHEAVSERMIQYYIAGKEPTKQALLAIAILLGLPAKELEMLLAGYGYSLSHSLENDAVVRWFLENDKSPTGTRLLYAVNDTLYSLGMPLLQTRQTGR